MDSEAARELFLRFGPAVAYVAVEGEDGTQHIGSAFHVGEGVFVTARHVVEKKIIVEVGLDYGIHGKYDEVHGYSDDDPPPTFMKWACGHVALEIIRGPFVSTKADVDVAAFVATGFDPDTPAIPLGDHLDDWLGVRDFVLSEAILMGYPPIPTTKKPRLVCARAEVNAIVDTYTTRHPHFVVSAMPRGGFSGGVAISEYGAALGLITQGLISDGKAEELGYFSVLSIEPIYDCLADFKLLPAAIAEQWDFFWNESSIDFQELDGAVGALAEVDIAIFQDSDIRVMHIGPSVSFYDDGRFYYVEVRPGYNHEDAANAANSIELAVGEFISGSTSDQGRHKFTFKPEAGTPLSELVRSATKAACDAQQLSFF